eukprot:3646796-Rhodomonas_salina.3
MQYPVLTDVCGTCELPMRGAVPTQAFVRCAVLAQSYARTCAIRSTNTATTRLWQDALVPPTRHPAAPGTNRPSRAPNQRRIRWFPVLFVLSQR